MRSASAGASIGRALPLEPNPPIARRPELVEAVLQHGSRKESGPGRVEWVLRNSARRLADDGGSMCSLEVSQDSLGAALDLEVVDLDQQVCLGQVRARDWIEQLGFEPFDVDDGKGSAGLRQACFELRRTAATANVEPIRD